MRMQRMFRIADLLPERESEAVTYKRLAETTGLSDRELRHAIRRERREGEPILSSKQGLWRWNGEDPREFEGTYKRLVKIGCDFLQTAQRMKDALKGGGVNEG